MKGTSKANLPWFCFVCWVGIALAWAQTAGFQGQPRLRFGIVLPFVDIQVDSRLFPLLDRWTWSRFSPCLSGTLLADTTVFFYHPGSSSPREASIIQHWAKTYAAVSRRCSVSTGGISRSSRSSTGDAASKPGAELGMEFLYAGLPPTVANKHPDGPCAQFYALFSLLAHKVDVLFVMEPDVLPLRRGWLQTLQAEAFPTAAAAAAAAAGAAGKETAASTAASFHTASVPPPSPSSLKLLPHHNNTTSPPPSFLPPLPPPPPFSSSSTTFWMKGSAPQCSRRYGDIAKRKDTHINGNALFRVGDPEFGSFLARVRAFYPAYTSEGVGVAGCSTGHIYEGGHDHCIFQFLQHRSNFELARAVAHRFQYSPAILNLCEEPYDPERVLSRYPHAAVVHSKAPYLDLFEAAVLRVYREMFNSGDGGGNGGGGNGGGGGGGSGLFLPSKAVLASRAAALKRAVAVEEDEEAARHRHHQHTAATTTQATRPRSSLGGDPSSVPLLASPLASSSPPFPSPSLRLANLTLTSPAAAFFFERLRRTLCASKTYASTLHRHSGGGVGISLACQKLCLSDAQFRADHLGTACRLAALQLRWASAVPPSRALVWTADFHASPIACDAPLLESSDVMATVHGEVDFNNCVHYPRFCRRRLKVLEFDNWKGFGLEPCPHTMRRRFFDAYKRDPEVAWRADLFVCSHPVANCELFLPFNRSILVRATTRLEFGRNDEYVDWRKPFIGPRSNGRWQEWVDNLKLLATPTSSTTPSALSGGHKTTKNHRRPPNIIAANNLFDVHYIKYHTGLDVLYLPSWCGGPPPSSSSSQYHHQQQQHSGGGASDTSSDRIGTNSESQHQSALRYNPQPGYPVLLGPYRDNLDYPEFDDAKSWKHPILRGLTDAISKRKRRRQEAVPQQNRQKEEMDKVDHDLDDEGARQRQRKQQRVVSGDSRDDSGGVQRLSSRSRKRKRRQLGVFDGFFKTRGNSDSATFPTRVQISKPLSSNLHVFDSSTAATVPSTQKHGDNDEGASSSMQFISESKKGKYRSFEDGGNSSGGGGAQPTATSSFAKSSPAMRTSSGFWFRRMHEEFGGGGSSNKEKSKPLSAAFDFIEKGFVSSILRNSRNPSSSGMPNSGIGRGVGSGGDGSVGDSGSGGSGGGGKGNQTQEARGDHAEASAEGGGHERSTNRFEWVEMMQYPAVVLIPYQVSTMFVFECYRHNVPLFAPSLELLVDWVQNHGILWERVYGNPQRLQQNVEKSEVENPKGSDQESDYLMHGSPNTLFNGKRDEEGEEEDQKHERLGSEKTTTERNNLRYWLGFSDWYHLEHVQLFDSWDHLLDLLESVDLKQLSADMAVSNAKHRKVLVRKWRRILDAATGRKQGPVPTEEAAYDEDYDDADGNEKGGRGKENGSRNTRKREAIQREDNKKGGDGRRKESFSGYDDSYDGSAWVYNEHESKSDQGTQTASKHDGSNENDMSWLLGRLGSRQLPHSETYDDQMRAIWSLPLLSSSLARHDQTPPTPSTVMSKTSTTSPTAAENFLPPDHDSTAFFLDHHDDGFSNSLSPDPPSAIASDVKCVWLNAFDGDGGGSGSDVDVASDERQRAIARSAGGFGFPGMGRVASSTGSSSGGSGGGEGATFEDWLEHTDSQIERQQLLGLDFARASSRWYASGDDGNRDDGRAVPMLNSSDDNNSYFSSDALRISIKDQREDIYDFSGGARCASWIFQKPNKVYSLDVLATNSTRGSNNGGITKSSSCVSRYILIECSATPTEVVLVSLKQGEEGQLQRQHKFFECGASQIHLADVSVTERATGAVLYPVSATFDSTPMHSTNPTSHFFDGGSGGGRLSGTSDPASSGKFGALRCVDGDPSTFCHSAKRPNTWLELDLGDYYDVAQVAVVNRQDCCQDRIVGALLSLLAPSPLALAVQRARRAEPESPSGGHSRRAGKSSMNDAATASSLKEVKEYAKKWCHEGVPSRGNVISQYGVCCAGADICGSLCGGVDGGKGCAQRLQATTAIVNTAPQCCIGTIRKNRRCCADVHDTACVLPPPPPGQGGTRRDGGNSRSGGGGGSDGGGGLDCASRSDIFFGVKKHNNDRRSQHFHSFHRRESLSAAAAPKSFH